MNESLTDKAVKALAMIGEIDSLLRDVNDYGKATGFLDEQDQIVNDFHALVGSMRARLSRLKRRIHLHNEAQIKNT